MKQTNYSYTCSYTYRKAPTRQGTRLEAVIAFISTSKLAPDATVALLRDWLGGLDSADTLAGDNLRAAVAAASEVVIARAEPIITPTVSTPMPPSLARVTVTAWRTKAAAVGTTPAEAELLTVSADKLEASITAAESGLFEYSDQPQQVAQVKMPK